MNLPKLRCSVLIESVELPSIGGFPQGVVLRVVSGQKVPATLPIEGNRSLGRDYPPGTLFRIQGTILKRDDGREYLFTSWQWDVQVMRRLSRESVASARRRRSAKAR